MNRNRHTHWQWEVKETDTEQWKKMPSKFGDETERLKDKTIFGTADAMGQ